MVAVKCGKVAGRTHSALHLPVRALFGLARWSTASASKNAANRRYFASLTSIRLATLKFSGFRYCNMKNSNTIALLPTTYKPRMVVCRL